MIAGWFHRYMVPVVMIVTLLGGTAILTLTIVLIVERNQRIESDCEFIEDSRQDSRSMWVYLLAEFPSEDTDRLSRVLDELLPPIECVDKRPITVKGQT